MKILIFDTETSGLPAQGQYDNFMHPQTPRLVELAYVVYDITTEEITHKKEVIVKPDGFMISPEASKIHGITHNRAMKEGHPLMDVLGKFIDHVQTCQVVVAHNLKFDMLVMRGEIYRNKFNFPCMPIHSYCTMQHTTDLCKLPGKYSKYKFPKLEEACSMLLDYSFEAHHALNDVIACLKLFLYLKPSQEILYDSDNKVRFQ